VINTLALTKQLISIPSWVGPGCDEIKIGKFIYDWLRTNTTLTVIKQPVKDGRFNVIATDGSPARIILAGHIDTVEPRAGWLTDPFTPTITNNRLYGLGATDMKGSLASMLTAVSEVKNTQGLMILCYIDEEYDFAGMRKFIQDYRGKIKPELIVSLDGSADQIGIGCRGLIELSFKIRGVSGHAGRPSAGKNAIQIGNQIINLLTLSLSKVIDPILGSSTCNLAYIQGGLDLGGGNLGRQGNNIADLAEFVLDIRTSKSKVNADSIIKQISGLAERFGVQLEDIQVRHNLGSWVTNPKDLIELNLTAKFEPSLGYIDTQMLWEAFGKVPCCTIGAGNLALAHTPNEYVELAELNRTQKLVERIINQSVTGETI